MKAESAVFSRDMEQVRRTTARTSQGFIHLGNESAKGFRKAENAITNLGLGMVGLTGKTGRLAEGLLMMGVGGPVMLALTAGLAAGALAYRHFTSATAEARKETDALIDTLVKAAQARRDALDPGAKARRALLGGEEEGEGLQARYDRLQKQLATARQGSVVTDEAGGAHKFVDSKEVARLEAELRKVAQAMAEVGQTYLDAMSKGHKKPKDAFDWFGVPQPDHIKEMLQVIADARAKLADSDPWAELVKKQQGTFKDRQTDSIDAEFEKAKAGVFQIERPAVFAKMEEDAKLWQETWENAIRGTQSAFADFFESIGQEGFRMVSIFEAIAKTIQRTLAEAAAQQLTAGLFGAGAGGGGGIGGLIGGVIGSIFGGGGGGGRGNATQSMGMLRGGIVGRDGTPRMVDPALFVNAPRFKRGGMIGADEVPIIAHRGERILPKGESGGGGGSGTTVVVNQNIKFNAGFVDGGSGQAWLKAQGGTIAGIIANAASDAPQFARHIVANGSR
jgi:hypothetical protein